MVVGSAGVGGVVVEADVIVALSPGPSPGERGDVADVGGVVNEAEVAVALRSTVMFL